MSTTQVSSRAGSIGLFAAVGAAIAFAGAAPFVKPLLEAGWSPGGAVFMRVALATLVLAPLVALAVRRDPGALLRRWGWIVAYGLLGVAGVQLLAFHSIERMPIGVSMLIQYMAPIILLLTVWLRTRVRPATLSLVGTGLAIMGLLCVLDLAGGATLDPLGVAFAGLAALTMCAYFLIGANAPADLPPVALIGGGFAVAAVATGALGVAGLVPIAVDLAGTAVLLGSSVPWWVPMAVVVLVGTATAYVFGTIGAKLLGSRLASFVALLEVVATVAVAAVMLGEIPTIMQITGGVLILGGVIAVRLAPDHAKPAVEGGVTDIVGPVTGVIPVPSQREEVAVATGTIELATRADGLAIATGVIALPTVDAAAVADAASNDEIETSEVPTLAQLIAAYPLAGPVELAALDDDPAEHDPAADADGGGEPGAEPVPIHGARSGDAAPVVDEAAEAVPTTTGSLIAGHVEALAAVGEALFGTAQAETGGEPGDDLSLPRVRDVEFGDDPHPVVQLIPIVQAPVIAGQAFGDGAGAESSAAESSGSESSGAACNEGTGERR
ncbi:hypothetical protein GCM10011490_12500 [Pseudoclavibacter endophyticus]|uniref:EamA family transporter n=1 Tax=Pseudoclavibacter endophyticus TaxID=1778590 RepID=A0A6H9WRD5_9MICO|nr:EamA family transporter [Pseudoclavibacter endophyticus]KAB1649335.1 EamA family transporter [Pseudoclavibacter endophyticus]GGA63391.1 hypothetical protein GCM10011490_12500 [Pseudoclavibacter endophyticus]